VQTAGPYFLLLVSHARYPRHVPIEQWQAVGGGEEGTPNNPPQSPPGTASRPASLFAGLRCLPSRGTFHDFGLFLSRSLVFQGDLHSFRPFSVQVPGFSGGPAQFSAFFLLGPQFATCHEKKKN